jgi:uncharacterized repeat protein (TIGR03803 family)
MAHNQRLYTQAVVLLTLLAMPVWTPRLFGAGKYKSLYSFKPTKGSSASPFSGLTFDQRGDLYGSTEFGGQYNLGTIFQLTRGPDGSWKEKQLHSFRGSDGALPQGPLIFDRAGNLYGTTFAGGNRGCNFSTSCGVVFELSPTANGSWREKVLFRFTGGRDGGIPTSGVILDQAGNLYGTTEFGGTSGLGTVFKLTPRSDGAWKEEALHSFSDTNAGGFEPTAGLIFDSLGNLYGTTALSRNHSNCSGSNSICGVAFKLAPTGKGTWGEDVLYTFCSLANCADGVEPLAGLILDAKGNLYGTTGYGGAFGSTASGGTVFELSPNSDGSWTESVLHSFCSKKNCADGEHAFSGLAFDKTGNLYGTTTGGGSDYCPGYGCGVVFKLIPDSGGGWRQAVLHEFADRPGALPFAGVIFDSVGNLYGTTYGDRTVTFGSVFEIAH